MIERPSQRGVLEPCTPGHIQVNQVHIVIVDEDILSLVKTAAVGLFCEISPSRHADAWRTRSGGGRGDLSGSAIFLIKSHLGSSFSRGEGRFKFAPENKVENFWLATNRSNHGKRT